MGLGYGRRMETTPAPVPPTASTPWHALSAEVALSRLRSAPTGLSPDDAAQRLAAHGPNRLTGATRPGAWRRLLGQFHNLLIYVLLAAAVAALGGGLEIALAGGHGLRVCPNVRPGTDLADPMGAKLVAPGLGPPKPLCTISGKPVEPHAPNWRTIARTPSPPR